jgi:hypothetical protein
MGINVINFIRLRFIHITYKKWADIIATGLVESVEATEKVAHYKVLITKGGRRLLSQANKNVTYE